MTPQQRSITTRDRILAAARALIAQEGIGALTMSTVAARAGVSRRTLHRYFHSRVDLADALANRSDPTEELLAQSQAASDGRRGDGRGRILEAARELFAARGYAGTTLREVAVHARISQPMLYRYFPSKDALFQEAAIAPINDFIDEYLRGMQDQPWDSTGTLQEETRAAWSQIYDLLVANRGLLTTLITASQFESGDGAAGAPLARLFAHSLDRIAAGLTEAASRSGMPGRDRELVARLFFGMAFSAALHGDWLLRESDTPERVIDEMAQLLVYGIAGSPPEADRTA